MQVVVSFRGTEGSKAQDVMVDAMFLPKSFPVHPADWQLLPSAHLQRCVTNAQVHSHFPISPPEKEQRNCMADM